MADYQIVVKRGGCGGRPLFTTTDYSCLDETQAVQLADELYKVFAAFYSETWVSVVVYEKVKTTETIYELHHHGHIKTTKKET